MAGREETRGTEGGLDPVASCFGHTVWKSSQTGGGSGRAGADLHTRTEAGM